LENHYKAILAKELITNNMFRHNLAMILSLIGRRPIVTYTKPKSKLGGVDKTVHITEPDEGKTKSKSPRNLNFLGRDEKLSKWIPTTSNVYGKKQLESDGQSSSSYSSVNSSDDSSQKIDMFD